LKTLSSLSRRRLVVPSRTVVIGLTLLLAAGAGSAGAQRSDSLPPAIATAFHQTYPGARILTVSRERRDGKVVYEIESRDGPMRRDLIYSLEGNTVEIEDILPADSVPAPVRTAVQRDLPGAAILGAERVTTGAVIVYEVQVKKSGRTRLLVYDPAGVRKE
jgi:putative PepSY-like beta-lactamase-inhibitor